MVCEGEIGVFITLLAYTLLLHPMAFGLRVVAYRHLSGGSVLGGFHEASVTEGMLGRFEFGCTR
jgi:hypothetical protein